MKQCRRLYLDDLWMTAEEFRDGCGRLLNDVLQHVHLIFWGGIAFGVGATALLWLLLWWLLI